MVEVGICGMMEERLLLMMVHSKYAELLSRWLAFDISLT